MNTQLTDAAECAMTLMMETEHILRQRAQIHDHTRHNVRYNEFFHMPTKSNIIHTKMKTFVL